MTHRPCRMCGTWAEERPMEQSSVRKTFKYKLKPTPHPEQALAFVMRRCRELYNAALQERRDAWQNCGMSITIASQSAQLPEIKEVRPEYRDIHSQVLQDVLTRLDRAFQAFFRRVKASEMRKLPSHYRRAKKQLATAHRRVSRRQKGSNRRKKAVALLKRKHQKVQRQRRTFQHKTALALLRQYEVIYLEDLQVRNLLRNPYLAKSISDAAWYQFRTILTFKAACAGKRVVTVPAQYTSQECSGCGERVLKSF